MKKPFFLSNSRSHSNTPVLPALMSGKYHAEFCIGKQVDFVGFGFRDKELRYLCVGHGFQERIAFAIDKTFVSTGFTLYFFRRGFGQTVETFVFGHGFAYRAGGGFFELQLIIKRFGSRYFAFAYILVAEILSYFFVVAGQGFKRFVGYTVL